MLSIGEQRFISPHLGHRFEALLPTTRIPAVSTLSSIDRKRENLSERSKEDMFCYRKVQDNRKRAKKRFFRFKSSNGTQVLFGVRRLMPRSPVFVDGCNEKKKRVSVRLSLCRHVHNDKLFSLRLASNEMIEKLISTIVRYLRQIQSDSLLQETRHRSDREVIEDQSIGPRLSQCWKRRTSRDVRRNPLSISGEKCVFH